MPSAFSPNNLIHYVPLAGSHRELQAGSRPAGPADPGEIIAVTVHVRSKAPQEDVESEFQMLARQPMKSRSYLSHVELAERYGARLEDLNLVEEFAHRYNLRIRDRNPAQQTVVLVGRVSDFSNAFKVELGRYHHHSGDYRGRTGSVYIPTQLAGVVTGVFGLDNRPKSRAHYHFKPLSQPAQAASGDADSGVPSGLFSGASLAARYNFPADVGGAALDGAGQSVAVIELGGGYLNNDLDAYFQRIGAPSPAVVAVSVDQAGNDPAPGADSPDGEVMLDIEVIGAVVPAARQVIYFGPNQDSGFFDAISAAVMDEQRRPSVISISWGWSEENETDQSLSALSNLFKKAALLGITICIATGDHGSINIDPQNPEFVSNGGRPHVQSPACIEGCLACGGTSITSQGEVAWNDGDGWAGGGGVSTRVSRPSWQDGAGVPEAPSNGFEGRGLPDVSGSATNIFVRVRGEFQRSGGTSAVAPLWAGLIARLNQAMQKRAGFLNPLLYSRPDVFTDITAGNNDITGENPPLYPAGAGWDPATGLGVPDGTAILNLL